MELKNLNELFTHEVMDVLSAEKQILAALPKIVELASTEELKSSLESHRQETERQRDRLIQQLEMLGNSSEPVECKGMKGLLQEGTKLVTQLEEGPLRDLAIVGATAKVEHYEISAYSSLSEMAAQLGLAEHRSLLDETLKEEKGAAEKLSRIAAKKLLSSVEADTNSKNASDKEGSTVSAQIGAGKETNSMRTSERERDQSGRFTSDDDRNRDRDDYRGSNRGRDDDRGDGNRGGGRDENNRGGVRDRDDNGRYPSGSNQGGRNYDDDRGRGQDDDRRGWYGDPQGHSEAARRGWDNRDDDRGGGNRGGGRDENNRGGGRDRDDNGRYTSGSNQGGRNYDDDRGRGRDDDRRGWYGDPQGHSEASRRGWDNRDDDRGGGNRGGGRDENNRGGGRDRDDNGRYTSGSNQGGRNYDDDRGRGRDDDRRGWYGDPQGHSEASRRGWDNRDDDRGGGNRGGGRDENNRGGRDDDRGSNRGGGRDDDGRGWHGDPQGHAEAARRGWENRDR